MWIFLFSTLRYTLQIYHNGLAKRSFYDIIIMPHNLISTFLTGKLPILVEGFVSIPIFRICQFEFGKNANSADEYGE